MSTSVCKFGTLLELASTGKADRFFIDGPSSSLFRRQFVYSGNYAVDWCVRDKFTGRVMTRRATLSQEGDLCIGMMVVGNIGHFSYRFLIDNQCITEEDSDMKLVRMHMNAVQRHIKNYTQDGGKSRAETHICNLKESSSKIRGPTEIDKFISSDTFIASYMWDEEPPTIKALNAEYPEVIFKGTQLHFKEKTWKTSKCVSADASLRYTLQSAQQELDIEVNLSDKTNSIYGPTEVSLKIDDPFSATYTIERSSEWTMSDSSSAKLRNKTGKSVEAKITKFEGDDKFTIYALPDDADQDCVPIDAANCHLIETPLILQGKQQMSVEITLHDADFRNRSCELQSFQVYLPTDARQSFLQTSHNTPITAVKKLEVMSEEEHDTQRIPLQFNLPVRNLDIANKFDYVRLIVNGQTRFQGTRTEVRTIDKFVNQRPNPKNGNDSIHFGLPDRDFQYGGAFNMSRADSVHLELKSPDDHGGKLQIYATYYNVLQYKDGIYSLMFMD